MGREYACRTCWGALPCGASRFVCLADQASRAWSWVGRVCASSSSVCSSVCLRLRVSLSLAVPSGAWLTWWEGNHRRHAPANGPSSMRDRDSRREQRTENRQGTGRRDREAEREREREKRQTGRQKKGKRQKRERRERRKTHAQHTHTGTHTQGRLPNRDRGRAHRHAAAAPHPVASRSPYPLTLSGSPSVCWPL